MDHKDSIATHIINPRRGTSNTKQTRLTVRRPGSTSHEVAHGLLSCLQRGHLAYRTSLHHCPKAPNGPVPGAKRPSDQIMERFNLRKHIWIR